MNLELVVDEWNSFVICELKAHSGFIGQYFFTPQYEKIMHIPYLYLT
jgi:hypothetical protein